MAENLSTWDPKVFESRGIPTEELINLYHRFAKPRAATGADIVRITTGFALAAEYLDKEGFDEIQLHAALGFLLAQCLSHSTNHRTDRYGGTLANRARLILEIAAHIRQRTFPGPILDIEINSVEFQEHGHESSAPFWESAGFDFVELSGDTYEQLAFGHKKESTLACDAFFIEFAEVVVASRKTIRAYITGGLRSAAAMVAALDVVDGVGIGKPTTQEDKNLELYGYPDLTGDVLS
ncbi:hypothetical protein QQZ08_008212 [Neonectria magnoliae]|uniref:NADH:flavin oxidoreductase/NADH oxidase N-terminal domain-containing protein n=1 Tax=Neonectria magnoliae TaxID=2732573 RepID=A0ABR1HWR7_9HYPO